MLSSSVSTSPTFNHTLSEVMRLILPFVIRLTVSLLICHFAAVAGSMAYSLIFSGSFGVSWKSLNPFGLVALLGLSLPLPYLNLLSVAGVFLCVWIIATKLSILSATVLATIFATLAFLVPLWWQNP